MFTAPISEITLGQVHRSPDLKGGISILRMATASGPSKPRSQGQKHGSLRSTSSDAGCGAVDGKIYCYRIQTELRAQQ